MNYRRKSQVVQAVQLTGDLNSYNWSGNKISANAGDWLVIDYSVADLDNRLRTYSDKEFKEAFELDIHKSTIINQQPYIGIRTGEFKPNPLFPNEVTCGVNTGYVRGGIYDDTLG